MLNNIPLSGTPESHLPRPDFPEDTEDGGNVHQIDDDDTDDGGVECPPDTKEDDTDDGGDESPAPDPDDSGTDDGGEEEEDDEADE